MPPPSIVRVAPVMKDALSDARNKTPLAQGGHGQIANMGSSLHGRATYCWRLVAHTDRAMPTAGTWCHTHVLLLGECCMLCYTSQPAHGFVHSASVAHWSSRMVWCSPCIPCCAVGMSVREKFIAHHKCTLPAQPTPASTQSTKSTRGPATHSRVSRSGDFNGRRLPLEQIRFAEGLSPFLNRMPSSHTT